MKSAHKTLAAAAIVVAALASAGGAKAAEWHLFSKHGSEDLTVYVDTSSILVERPVVGFWSKVTSPEPIDGVDLTMIYTTIDCAKRQYVMVQMEEYLNNAYVDSKHSKRREMIVPDSLIDKFATVMCPSVLGTRKSGSVSTVPHT